MNIHFQENDPNIIIENLKEAMGGRALAKIVSFDLKGEDLTVTLSKLGKSTLFFSGQKAEDGYSFALTKEKIALAHKALKGEVTEKIVRVIEKAGGSVS